MQELMIYTKYHEATQFLLMRFDLAECKAIANIQEGLVINYPNDALSQEMSFWLSLAQGCGLVDGYQLQETANTEATKEPPKKDLDHQRIIALAQDGIDHSTSFQMASNRETALIRALNTIIEICKKDDNNA